MDEFQKRIKFGGDIKAVLKRVTFDYNLGAFEAHRVIPVGYEDYNLILSTTKGKYFIKIFVADRTKADCERYINVIQHVLQHGVQHPKLLKCRNKFFYSLDLGSVTIRLCVMEYINGKSLYDLKENLKVKEAKFLIKQIALINRINLKPKFVYDSWAVTNFLREYKKKRKYHCKLCHMSLLMNLEINVRLDALSLGADRHAVRNIV